MGFQYAGLPWQTVSDVKTRVLMKAIDEYLRSVSRVLETVVDLDRTRGIARLRAPLVPTEVPGVTPLAPTGRSTFGRQGEIRRVNGQIYVRTGVGDAEDTEWEAFQPGGAAIGFVPLYYQTTEPTGIPEEPALWWKDLGAAGTELWLYAPVKTTGVWTWRRILGV